MSTSSTDEPAMISKDGKALLAHVDLDLLQVETAVAQLLAQLLARPLRLLAKARRLLVVVGRRRQRRQQQVEHALFGSLARLFAHLGDPLLADHVDGELVEVAHHRFDVAADVADLGVLRRLDLDERRLRQPGQPPRDLGLADAGRTDHQDVLRRDFLGQLRRQLLSPRAVAQRDRDGALGASLPDDVLVELGDDLTRRQRFHGRGRCFRQVDGHVRWQALQSSLQLSSDSIDLVVGVDADARPR